MGLLSRVSEFMRGPRAIIGSRDHMPGPLPMRRPVHEWHYIDPPTPPGWRETSFGMFHAETGRFIDSHGKGGTYYPATQRLMDSEGVVMSRQEFDMLPKKQRRVEFIKVGEDLV